MKVENLNIGDQSIEHFNSNSVKSFEKIENVIEKYSLNSITSPNLKKGRNINQISEFDQLNFDK